VLMSLSCHKFAYSPWYEGLVLSRGIILRQFHESQSLKVSDDDML
jgi:hypothetical protein